MVAHGILPARRDLSHKPQGFFAGLRLRMSSSPSGKQMLLSTRRGCDWRWTCCKVLFEGVSECHPVCTVQLPVQDTSVQVDHTCPGHRWPVLMFRVYRMHKDRIQTGSGCGAF